VIIYEYQTKLTAETIFIGARKDIVKMIKRSIHQEVLANLHVHISKIEL
jgi:hypothetical protein